MARYDIYDVKGKLIQAGVSAKEAGEILGVCPEEVKWAIEEDGLCSDDHYVVVGHKDPYPA